ncbi:MAG: STAS domain-containing protein [Planctomycetaceae bacterium]|nr:STAS domain-containing protein [Planctomycetaceae bacterium]
MRFETTVQGTVVVLRVDGVLAEEHLTNFAEQLEQRVSNGQPRIVIDMSAAIALDSATMELLLDVQDACLRRGGAVKLVGVHGLCREIMEINEVDRLFESFPSQVAAIGSFAT